MGRNGRERLESGNRTAENTESTERGGQITEAQRHREERAVARVGVNALVQRASATVRWVIDCQNDSRVTARLDRDQSSKPVRAVVRGMFGLARRLLVSLDDLWSVRNAVRMGTGISRRSARTRPSETING